MAACLLASSLESCKVKTRNEIQQNQVTEEQNIQAGIWEDKNTSLWFMLWMNYKIPPPVQKCCLKVIGIVLEGEMMSFQLANGFGYRFSIVWRGKGAHNCHLCSENRTGVENSQQCMGVPRTFGRHCRKPFFWTTFLDDINKWIIMKFINC